METPADPSCISKELCDGGDVFLMMLELLLHLLELLSLFLGT